MSKPETKTRYSSSVSISGLLGVAFVVLKLCNVIHWSWWLVTLPFWGPLALLAGFLLTAAVVSVLTVAGVFICQKLRS